MKDFVTPHIRIMPKLGQEIWIQKLAAMNRLHHNTEYETVKYGIRKAAIIHVDQYNLDELLTKFNRDGLVYTPILKSGIYQGYSHCHKPVGPNDPFFWYGSVTKTYEEGQKFKEAELKSDHLTIGTLLGFPECCINYFIKWFPKNYDPIWADRNGAVVGYPECNQMFRYFGARITTHFSCSPNCKKTREVGKKWFEIMKKIDKNTSADLYQLLIEPVVWNSYHGVVQTENKYFVGVTQSFPYIKKPRIIKWIGGVTHLN
mgnify:CR=1 FL=1